MGRAESSSFRARRPHLRTRRPARRRCRPDDRPDLQQRPNRLADRTGSWPGRVRLLDGVGVARPGDEHEAVGHATDEVAPRLASDTDVDGSVDGRTARCRAPTRPGDEVRAAGRSRPRLGSLAHGLGRLRRGDRVAGAGTRSLLPRAAQDRAAALAAASLSRASRPSLSPSAMPSMSGRTSKAYVDWSSRRSPWGRCSGSSSPGSSCHAMLGAHARGRHGRVLRPRPLKSRR